MTRERLREILIGELEQADGLPPNAAEHIEAVRRGAGGPAFAAVLRAMELAVREAGGM